MKSLFNQLLLICSLGLIGMTTIQSNELVSNDDKSGFYNFTLNTIDGVPNKMSTYQGKVCLIVNVASKCGYTSQYANLEKVYQEYKNKGFMVLGFPANNFGGQEPGTDQEIKTFCSSTYNVTFNMYGKISVKGNDKHPLFTFLTSGAANSNLAGEIGWNFEKFLIDKNGKLIKRYKSNIDPMSLEMKTDIENALK